MQEHVKLEISLEIIINKIANVIRKINSSSNEYDKKKLEIELKTLYELKEKAYQGDKNAIEEILNFGRNDDNNE